MLTPTGHEKFFTPNNELNRLMFDPTITSTCSLSLTHKSKIRPLQANNYLTNGSRGFSSLSRDWHSSSSESEKSPNAKNTKDLVSPKSSTTTHSRIKSTPKRKFSDIHPENKSFLKDVKSPPAKALSNNEQFRFDLEPVRKKLLIEEQKSFLENKVNSPIKLNPINNGIPIEQKSFSESRAKFPNNHIPIEQESHSEIKTKIPPTLELSINIPAQQKSHSEHKPKLSPASPKKIRPEPGLQQAGQNNCYKVTSIKGPQTEDARPVKKIKITKVPYDKNPELLAAPPQIRAKCDSSDSAVSSVEGESGLPSFDIHAASKLQNISEWLVNGNIKSAEDIQGLLEPENIVCLFKCPILGCKYSVNDPSYFNLHLNSHANLQQAMYCLYCLKRCSKITQYIRHIKKYHRERLYQCNLCLFRATFYGHIEIHQKQFHEDSEQPPKILICERAVGLEKKEIVPVSYDPIKYFPKYLCTTCCNFGSNTAEELHYHHIEEHKQRTTIPCQFCKSSYFVFEKYLKHLKLHNMNKYNCAFCTYNTDMKSQIFEHLTSYHPDQNPTYAVRELN